MHGKILAWALLLMPTLLMAQKVKVHGRITDASTGEYLVGANVFDAKTMEGTSANVYGYYSVAVAPGAFQLKVSIIGYQTYTGQLSVSKDTLLNIALQPAVYALGEAEVQADAEVEEGPVEQVGMSTVSLSAMQIKQVPAMMGEQDLVKVLQLLPGVQSGREGSSNFYVRGGGPDQNLILLDGVPVYNVSHLLGFLSVFNTDAIKKVDLYKGGFPARYGGRLSSVIDIQLKEGNNQSFHAQGSLGLLSSKVLLEGPLVKGKSSFLLSARRSYADAVFTPIVKASNGDLVSYYFYDINLKGNYYFTSKDRLYLSLYGGEDRFRYHSIWDTRATNEASRYQMAWGNATGVLRWNHIYGSNLFSNVSLTYTQYGFQTESYAKSETKGDNSEAITSSVSYQSLVKDAGLRIDYDWFASSAHAVKFGAGAIARSFKPNAVRQKFETGANNGQVSLDSVFGNKPVLTYEINAYLEDEVAVSERLSGNVGVHLVSFGVKGKSYFSIQPRASARYRLSEKVALKGSFVQMMQPLHLLSNSSVGMPTDIWVPATANIQPQRAWQIAAGMAKSLKEGKYTLEVEAYYKGIKNAVEFTEGTDFLREGPETDFRAEAGYDWERKIAQGTGNAYGLEMLVNKKAGQTTGWIGYTLSWSNRTFEKLNFGNPFPYKYDRRHDLSVTINHAFNDRLSLGMNWVFGTGNAITMPIARYMPLSNYVNNAGWPVQMLEYVPYKNNYRMKPYHRMDIGLTHKKQKKRYVREWNVSLYNAYSRKNPYFIYWQSKFVGDTRPNVAYQVSLFPILPSVSYRFTF